MKSLRPRGDDDASTPKETRGRTRLTLRRKVAATLAIAAAVTTLSLTVAIAGPASAVSTIDGKYKAYALCDGTYHMATIRAYQDRINLTGWEQLDLTLSAWSTTKGTWVYRKTYTTGLWGPGATTDAAWGTTLDVLGLPELQPDYYVFRMTYTWWWWNTQTRAWVKVTAVADTTNYYGSGLGAYWTKYCNTAGNSSTFDVSIRLP